MVLREVSNVTYNVNLKLNSHLYDYLFEVIYQDIVPLKFKEIKYTFNI